jgi:hypothetical protein
MLSRILAQMNATLQPEDELFTLDDAEQHVNDYNEWVDEPFGDPENFPISDDDTQCDCGWWHNHKSYLNAATGNWLCRACIEEIDNAERKRKQLEYEYLQAKIEYLSKPENMFAAFLHAKRTLDKRSPQPPKEAA